MTETITLVEAATLCGGGCDAPLHDGFTLCPKHQQYLTRDLAAVPEVWANLQVTVRMQDATSSAIGGGATGSRPCMNLDAHDKGETLTALLNGWAGALSLDHRQRTAIDAAVFLTSHMSIIVHEDWAGDLADELHTSLRKCRAATDRAIDWISLGTCGFNGLDACDGEVLAIAGATEGHCRTCDSIWNVQERQQWKISEAWHATGSLRFLVQALREAKHISLNYETIRKRGLRGKLFGRCDLATREHIYTAADVWHSCQKQPLPAVALPVDTG